MTTPSRIHELLPWYATGTLNETETLEFRDHLSGCEDCREEMATVEELKAELEIHGKAYLDDHPPAGQLVAAVRGELGDEKTEKVRRHLSICAACAVETAWIRGESAAVGDAAVTRARARSPWATAAPWGWVAAAAILAIAVLWPPASDEFRTGIYDAELVVPSERGEGSRNTFALNGEGVRLLLDVDLPADAFPVSVEVRDASENVVFSQESIEQRSLVGGLYMIFDCSATVCAPGSYGVRVMGAGESGQTLRFSFTMTGPSD